MADESNGLMPLTTCAHVAALGVHLKARTAIAELQNSIIKQSIGEMHDKDKGNGTLDSKVTSSSDDTGYRDITILSLGSDYSERATEVITSEYICRVAFFECFLITDRQDTCTVGDTIKALSKNGEKFFLSIEGKDHLELDDMLWIVDNQSLSAERRREWHRFILKEREREESECFEQHLWQHPHHTGGYESSTKTDGNMPMPIISSISSKISVGHASTSQITLLRFGVEATSTFLAKLDRKEKDYQIHVQQIREEEANRLRSHELSGVRPHGGSRKHMGNLSFSSSTSEQVSLGATMMSRLMTFKEEVSSGTPLKEAFAASTQAESSAISETDDGRDNTAFRQLLAICPPVSWKETLSLNIVTQWTYTLTCAVVKYTTVYRDMKTHKIVDGSLTSNGTKRFLKNKELVVMRHVSKRVYGQPTKANFHSKHSRSVGGDIIDYPNIYFNIDDFEDEQLFRDIRLSKGYTFAVLLTAGASRDSNAVIFRGALSYEQIMKRILENPKKILNDYTSVSDIAGMNSSHSGSGNLGKLFIPLVGPEGKGSGEMSVTVSEIDLLLSNQSSRLNGSNPSEEPPNNNFFGKLISIVKKTSQPSPMPALQGNEAIQCCLTYISVHVQTVIDTIMNVEPLRPTQWLTFCNERELECILSPGFPSK